MRIFPGASPDGDRVETMETDFRHLTQLESIVWIDSSIF